MQKRIVQIIFAQRLSDFFQKPFLSARPDWLKWRTGRNLELDGYEKDLEIAFEYQGLQHFEFVEFFHGHIENFKVQLEKDEFKIKQCSENNVELIAISQMNNPSIKKAKDLVFSLLTDKGFKPVSSVEKYE